MPLLLLPVTLSLAAGLALINLWLAARTSLLRVRTGIMLGDEGSAAMRQRMRAQANLVENAPFVLALVGLIEFSRGPSWWLWAAAALFLVARLLHPFGMDGWRPGRLIGAAITTTLLLVLSLWALAIVFTAPAPHGHADAMETEVPNA